MTDRLVFGAAPIVAAMVCLSAQTPRRHVDRILVNGNIWTGDPAKPHAAALAVAGDTIVAIGSSAEVRSLATADTAVLDVGGRLVVPGFQDSHLHFPGASVDEVDLHGATTLAEFQKRLADFARAHQTLRWITGQGWDYAAFPHQTVDRQYIDAIISDRPVYVRERDGHMGLANSKAIQIAEVSAKTPDPPNGHIMRSTTGEPTGEFKESAQRLITQHIPVRSTDDLYRSLIQHMDEAAAAGLTAVQDAMTDLKNLGLYERAASEKALKLRFRFAPPILPGEGASPKEHRLKKPLTETDLTEYRALRDRFRGPLLEFGAVKGVLDGTIDARTAAMVDPYVGGGRGIAFWEADDLNRTVALYDKDGFQVMLHAIGDKAINMALNAFEYAATTNGTSKRRHRIEHAEVPLLFDLPRFERLGVIASTQAMFASPDATVLENFARLLGPDRAAHADSFRIYDDAGIVQAFGSDWGVFPFEPLPAI